MTVYAPSIDADLLLLNWYLDLGSGPDFESTFSAELAPCGAFLAAMQRTLLVYEADERGIWGAIWFDRQMSAGLFGLWLREDKRHTRRALAFILDGISFGLERFPVLICVTRRDEVVRQMTALGFASLGVVPWVFDGEAATLAWLDASTFRAATAKYDDEVIGASDG